MVESTIDNWTHKLEYGDLTPEMQAQVHEKHKTSKNKPATGDKYQYHVNITTPPKGYVGHLPYGEYSHRSIRDRNEFSSGKVGDNNVVFKHD